MTLRLIEIYLSSQAPALEQILASPSVINSWQTQLGDETTLIRILVRVQDVEVLVDDLQSRLGQTQGFRLILLPVEATLPRLEESPPAPEDTSQKKSPERIWREELYADIAHSATLTRVFVGSTVLATLVAAVGLMRDDTAIIIGAMVIAPLLGPNMSLCLATTLGDWPLAKKSLRTNAAGLAVALIVSLVVGSILTLDPTSESIHARTEVNLGDVVLALAAGAAGVMAFTTGAPASLIGVMVAVALLPPFTVFGLMMAAGEFGLAQGALILVATNVICVNLAGVFTFVVQGIRPRAWWEAARAKQATRISLIVWVALLALLIFLILNYGHTSQAELLK